MNVRFVGIDLAKNVFQIHGTDEAGQAVVRKTVTRAKLLNFAKPSSLSRQSSGWKRVAVRTSVPVALLSWGTMSG